MLDGFRFAEQVADVCGGQDGVIQYTPSTSGEAPMRRVGILVVACIIIVSAGVAAIIIWQAEAGNISLRTIRYATGGLMVVVGLGFAALRLSVSDERLHRQFGDSADQIRRLWRSGWIGAFLGAAIIAAEYFLGNGQ